MHSLVECSHVKTAWSARDLAIDYGAKWPTEELYLL